MSICMALVDFIPVILFLMAGMRLLHDFYHLMSKGAFSLFAAGILLVFTAGLYKAVWKLLYALGICDFAALNGAFFPMQSTGFILGAIGMFGLLFFPQKETIRAVSTVPALYASNVIFVLFTIAGTAGIWLSLAYVSWMLKKKSASIILLLSFFCMLAMGYLSSRNAMDPMINWIAEGTNILGMSLFLIAVKLMHQAGLETFELKA